MYATFNGPPIVTYYHADVLGSVRAITDGSGSTVAVSGNTLFFRTAKKLYRIE